MNKYLKVAIVVAIVIGVFVLSFLASGKESVEIITYKDYTDIKADEGFVYYGPKEDEEVLKTFADSVGIEISILDPSDLSKSEIKSLDLKEGTLYLYQEGQNVYKYEDELTQYNLVSAFMEEGLVDRTYITITLDDYLDIIKEDGYHFMFIGRESCSWCTEFKNSINESLKDYDYNIYYLDLDSLTEEDKETLYATDDYFNENKWGTPLSFLYNNGKRVAELSGYAETDELVSFLKENKVI